MVKLYIFNFDGTCNSPEDAVQTVCPQGQIEDDSITNILKFHLLCGGSLAEQGKGWNDSQKCYYYAGIGTYGTRLQQAINAVFSPEGSDVRHILNRAISEWHKSGFDQHRDILLVTGFSRGAALARRFAKLISDQVSQPCIYEAVFDTVASINRPNLRKSDRPCSEVVFENHTLPVNVVKALHLVSLDEKRRAFQPTLMNAEGKVTEVWFPGAHADVGGGYYQDGLSDLALRYALNWIDDLEIGCALGNIQDIDYGALLPHGVDYHIGEDDVIINPNPLGVSHEQMRWWPIAWATLCDRLCCVISNDRVVEGAKPLVHWSVAERIYRDSDYRPESLKGVTHALLHQDGELIPCTGIRAHVELPQQNLSTLEVNESKVVAVFAAEKYNRTGLWLQAGAIYTFAVEGKEVWWDAGIECSAVGWDRAGVTLGLKELAIATVEPFRRVAEANWFELCASIGSEDKEVFRIGRESTFSPRFSGEFCPFANDLERFYGNNRGRIRCKVTRIK
ncbi:T6SS phospholipase effector Tle1-like catalytic domain-containing protein [Photobacterium aquae]|nr:DUF2235 domain-containing protein [Photobacterium aquae]